MPITPTTHLEKSIAGEVEPVTHLEQVIAEYGGGGGGGGESTIAWKPSVSPEGVISWTRTSSTTKPADQNIKGEDGNDGYSPTVTITPITGGNRVTITDADGDHSFDVKPNGNNFEVGAEKWYGTYKEDGVTYQVYSKIIKIDALPSAAGTTTYPHGIAGIKQILQVYGFCSNGFVVNAPRQNLQDNIAVYQASKSASNQNISIEVGKDRSSLSAYVCLVYAKNN